MMAEEELNLENIAFAIVGHVGAARSMVMEAVRLSRSGDFEGAQRLMDQANDELVLGEREHFKVVTREAKSGDVKLSMLLVHAEDQMMAAETIRDLAVEMIETNRRLAKLETRE